MDKFDYVLINRKEVINLNNGNIYSIDEALANGLKKGDVLVCSSANNRKKTLNRTFFLNTIPFQSLKYGECSTIIAHCESTKKIKRSEFAKFSTYGGSFEIKTKGSIRIGLKWDYVDMDVIQFCTYALYCERADNDIGFVVRKIKEIPPFIKITDFFKTDMMCIYE